MDAATGRCHGETTLSSAYAPGTPRCSQPASSTSVSPAANEIFARSEKYVLVFASSGRYVLCRVADMIRLTRLNGEGLILNSELIECIEATPDTVITTTSGRSMMVRESIDQVVERVSDYRRSLRVLPVIMRDGEGPGA
jgi:flagellar protein FlbD